MTELISKSKELLGFTKTKKRKPRHYEFATDPVTGFRNNKGTYNGPAKTRRTNSISTPETCESHVESDGGKFYYY